MANINDIYGSSFLKASDIKDRDSVKVTIEKIEFVDLNDGTKPLAHFKGKDKGLVLNKTNSQAIAAVFSPETNNWVGKSLELFVMPVNFNGQMVDSIRVRPLRGASAASAPVAEPAPAEFKDDDIPF